MAVIDKLASSLNVRSEAPNEALAKEIAGKNDVAAVKELISNLSNKNKNIQGDCIKVLYEIGEQKPELIAGYANDFTALLDNKSNRLQWGAMTALDAITTENPELIFSSLAKIIAVAGSGSVITKDHCVNILIKLCAIKQYAADAYALLLEQLQSCPTNQLPMYAENALHLINKDNKATFIKTLSLRLGEIEKDTKRSRVEKVIKRVS